MPETSKLIRSEKGLPVLLAIAQKLFNKFIRERDYNDGCISCKNEVEHAGHYLPQGAYSSLRFNEYNVNGQCGYCNTFKSGNELEYRIRLIDKIGLAEVESLESAPKYYKWSRSEVLEIIRKYK